MSSGTIILLMGVSGSGKTTLGKKIKARLEVEAKRRVEFIDGDHTRQFIGNELGYTEKDRFLVTKIIVYAAALLAENGIHVVVSNICGKQYVRDYMAAKWGDHVQIFLNADIADCIANDPRGIYGEAMKNDPPNIMGLDIAYDRPSKPDLILRPYKESIDQSLEKIFSLLETKALVKHTPS